MPGLGGFEAVSAIERGRMWTLDGPEELDFRVVDPKTKELLASARFRVR